MELLQGDVKVPGAGPVPRKYVVIGLAAVAGYVGYAYWKRSQTASADPAAADPAPEDITDYSGGVYTGGGGSTTPGLAGGDTSTQATEPDPYDTAPATNAAWERRAIEYMTGTLSYDGATVASALGKYLARQPVGAAEADIINTARGVIGPPPVGEFTVILIGTPSTPVPSSPATPGAPHIHHVYPTRTSANVNWYASTPAAVRYIVYRNGTAVTTSVTGTSYTVSGLKPGTSYTFTVAGFNAAGVRGPVSNAVTIKTPS